ncbi:MAG: RNA polymerase sporulation sigma factor SigK [Agathobacter sp.]|nr:RNA polymerase sporulation sigma factor SigK [Agathobacter sp.]
MKTFCNPLSETEEKEYFEQMQQGSLEAKERLVLHNMRLVTHVIKRYGTAGEDMEDLISIGTVGLLKAVDSFKPGYGSRFATYGIRCIENEILMYFRSKKKNKYDISLYEPIGTDKEGNQIHLVDVVENPQKDMTESVEDKTLFHLISQKMEEVLEPRELLVLRMRYGLDGNDSVSQREIAGVLGISRSYVSRIEKHALEKLRDLLE